MELSNFPSDEALQRLYRSGKTRPITEVSNIVSMVLYIDSALLIEFYIYYIYYMYYIYIVF